MASGILRAPVSNVVDKTPALSKRSTELQRWGREIFEKSTLGESEQTAFDQFGEQLLRYVWERIHLVTEGLTLNSSKWFNIWSDFHQIRLDNSGPFHSAWNELQKVLCIREATILEQSLYSELYTMLVAEYFGTQSPSLLGANVSTPIQFTTDELCTCGYVPRNLLNKYENKSGTVCIMFGGYGCKRGK